MSDTRHNWVATPTETRIAWVVATAMAILVVGAFLWPQSESEKRPSGITTKEQPQEESIEKIIARAQSSEKHQIKAADEPASEPATSPEPAPVTKPIAKADPVPAIKKTAPVITPKTATTTVVKKASASVSKLSAGYYVQTGAFSERKRAEALVKKLSTSWKTQIKKKSNNLFAVWSGPYANSKEATAAKNSIAMRTNIKGFIVKN